MVFLVVVVAMFGFVANTHAEDQPPGESERLPYHVFVPAAATDERWIHSEVLDPDEPTVDRNDIAAVRVSASSAIVRVRMTATHPEGFELGTWMDSGLLPVSASLVFREPGVGFDVLINVFIRGTEAWVLKSEAPPQDAIPAFVPLFVPVMGDVHELWVDLPRDLFATAKLVVWGASGTNREVTVDPECTTQLCNVNGFDRVPDFDVEHPELFVPPVLLLP